MLAQALLLLLVAASAASPSPSASHDFMELNVHKAQGDRELPGHSQAAHSKLSARTGLGGMMSSAEDTGTRQLMLGGGLMILFFICIFLMQETEDPGASAKARASPKPSTKKLSKSGSSGRLSTKRSTPPDTPNPSPAASAARLPNVPFADEKTLLLDDLRRQEDELKRQEAAAWRRQEELVNVEKQALHRREDELRARYERMEGLSPKPALYIPMGSSPLAFSTAPRSAPLYEPYAAREAREKRQVLEATEQGIVQSSPFLSDRQPFGTSPPGSGALGMATSSFTEARPYQLQAEARRDEYVGGGAGQQPPATAPALSSSYGFAAPSTADFGSPAPPATAPSLSEEEMTPEQRQTLQNIMAQTGASREATIRAMQKARQEEEAILRELEAKRRRAAAPG